MHSTWNTLILVKTGHEQCESMIINQALNKFINSNFIISILVKLFQPSQPFSCMSVRCQRKANLFKEKFLFNLVFKIEKPALKFFKLTTNSPQLTKWSWFLSKDVYSQISLARIFQHIYPWIIVYRILFRNTSVLVTLSEIFSS